MKFYIIFKENFAEKDMNPDDLVNGLYDIPEIDQSSVKLYYRDIYLEPYKPIKYYFPYSIATIYVYAKNNISLKLYNINNQNSLLNIFKMIQQPVIIIGCYVIFLRICSLIISS
jgi:hypothetical protein